MIVWCTNIIWEEQIKNCSKKVNVMGPTSVFQKISTVTWNITRKECQVWYQFKNRNDSKCGEAKSLVLIEESINTNKSAMVGRCRWMVALVHFDQHPHCDLNGIVRDTLLIILNDGPPGNEFTSQPLVYSSSAIADTVYSHWSRAKEQIPSIIFLPIITKNWSQRLIYSSRLHHTSAGTLSWKYYQQKRMWW
jgi:hypothetical protein